MTAPTPGRGAAFLLGVRALLPMHLGVVPFGIIYGVVALQSGIPPLAAVLMSSVVFAGSAQFLLAQLVGAGAPGLLMIGAVGLVNLRHVLYSASVAPMLRALPRRWKVLLAYLLTDEAYAAAIPHLMSGAAHGHWILFGAGFALWAGWQAATLVGGPLAYAGYRRARRALRLPDTSVAATEARFQRAMALASRYANA